MQTFEKQKQFFQDQWGGMKEAAESGGAAAVVRFIEEFEEATQQRVLYSFARMGLAMDDWQGKTFDTYIEVCQAGIRHFLADAETETDAEAKRKRIDGANMISFNLAADLADCWPGDDVPRNRQHFEAGVRAAEDCIRWREELGKGPAPRSMAHWAKGMHQLSLGDAAGAIESMRSSLDYAIAAAGEQDHPTSISADGDFPVLLGAGYLGLAEWVIGKETGEIRYAEAIAAFTDQLEIEGKKDDAQFGIDQLECVKEKAIR